jgi:hypothetical protein
VENQRTFYSVVIAHPGDADEAASALLGVIQQLNAGVLDAIQTTVVAKSWSLNQRPGLHALGAQGLADDILSIPTADLVVAVFNERLGTPVSDAPSGTAHEVLTAFRAWLEQGRPDAWVYFHRSPTSSASQCSAAESERLDRFKTNLPQSVVWCPYSEPNELKYSFSNQLTDFLVRRSRLTKREDGRQLVAWSVDSDLATIRSEGLSEPLGSIYIHLVPISQASVTASVLRATLKVYFSANLSGRLDGVVGRGLTGLFLAESRLEISWSESSDKDCARTLQMGRGKFQSPGGLYFENIEIPLAATPREIIMRVSGLRVNAAQLPLSSPSSVLLCHIVVDAPADAPYVYISPNPIASVALSQKAVAFLAHKEESGLSLELPKADGEGRCVFEQSSAPLRWVRVRFLEQFAGAFRSKLSERSPLLLVSQRGEQSKFGISSERSLESFSGARLLLRLTPPPGITRIWVSRREVERDPSGEYRAGNALMFGGEDPTTCGEVNCVSTAAIARLGEATIEMALLSPAAPYAHAWWERSNDPNLGTSKVVLTFWSRSKAEIPSVKDCRCG